MLQKIISQSFDERPLFTDISLVFDVADSNFDDIAWAYIYKSSDFPELTTTKPYFTLYSTDHSTNANGKIGWGEMDDLEFTNFVFRGIILQDGYQCEFPILMRIPTEESGLQNDSIFLYYHSQNKPEFTIEQETKVMTTSGGAELHNCTWTDRGQPVTIETGDNHTGYLRMFKRGYKDYICQHIRLSGGTFPFTDYQSWSTTTDGLTINRGGNYTLLFNGHYWWRHDIQPFHWQGKLYGLITYYDGGSNVTLVELNETTYLPETFIKKIFQKTYTDMTSYLDGDTLYVYLRNKDFTNAEMPIENSLYLTKINLHQLI